MVEMEVREGVAVIRQGAPGDHFYVVVKGHFDAYISSVGDGKVSVKAFEAADSFGELALMYNTPRAATVRCTEGPGTLWSLSRKSFRAILTAEEKASEARTRSFLRAVPMFEALSQDQLSRVASVCETVRFDERTTVVRQGEIAEHLYVVTEGRAFAQRWGSQDRFEMLPRTCFGESALAKSSTPEARMRKADVVAEPGCSMLCLGVNDFRAVVGVSLDDVARRNLNMKLMEAVKFGGKPISTMMPQAERERLADAFEEAVFTQGERCIAEGDDGDRFFLIRSGSASVKTRQRGEIASIGEGDFFGEMALISDAPRSATVTATSKQLTCLTIRRHTFTKLFGPLQELLEAHTAARTTEIGHTSLGDLKQYQIIGSGSFGHVTLCLHAKGGACYALKAMLKGRLAAQSQIERVLYEREALRKCSHPFIVTLAATLQDVETVYLLLEYVPGGELFSILQATRFLVDPVGAFYAACVTSALEHMHDRTIVYRDLKPENLLIDLEGYLKIVDFGFAKVTSTKTYTLCGTPEYLAPEIVLNQGHLYGADWWALGVLTYEMLVGAPPFADELEPMNIYKKILDAKLPEPKRNEPSLSKHARAFVQQLLTKEPSHRLGTLSKGAEDVRTHAFLGRINWRRLEKKLLQPPCTPQLSGPMDTSAYAVLSNPPYSSTDWGSSLTREVQRLFEEW